MRWIAFVSLVAAILTGSGCGRQQEDATPAGGGEVKAWVAELHDPKPAVRRQAVVKLRNAGATDPAAAEGLGEALDDTDALVRREAVLAVMKLKQPGQQILERLKTMRQSDRDPQVRDAAQRALAKLEIHP